MFLHSDIRHFGNNRVEGVVDAAVVLGNGYMPIDNSKIFVHKGKEYLETVKMPIPFSIYPKK